MSSSKLLQAEVASMWLLCLQPLMLIRVEVWLMCSYVTSVTGDPGSAQNRLSPGALGKRAPEDVSDLQIPFPFCHSHQ